MIQKLRKKKKAKKSRGDKEGSTKSYRAFACHVFLILPEHEALGLALFPSHLCSCTRLLIVSGPLLLTCLILSSRVGHKDLVKHESKH